MKLRFTLEPGSTDGKIKQDSSTSLIMNLLQLLSTIALAKVDLQLQLQIHLLLSIQPISLTLHQRWTKTVSLTGTFLKVNGLLCVSAIHLPDQKTVLL